MVHPSDWKMFVYVLRKGVLSNCGLQNPDDFLIIYGVDVALNAQFQRWVPDFVTNHRRPLISTTGWGGSVGRTNLSANRIGQSERRVLSGEVCINFCSVGWKLVAPPCDLKWCDQVDTDDRADQRPEPDRCH